MKLKVLILVHKIQHYRIPIFNSLNESFDVTVASDTPIDNKNINFNTLLLPIIRVGPFLLHRINLFKIANKFDVVIGLYNIRCIDLMMLSMAPRRKFKLIFWGIGVTASYEKHFDSKNRFDFLRYYFGKRADALIFYSEYPLSLHVDKGIDKRKLFVAHNTVVVLPSEPDKIERNTILFIGTLYKEKGISDLLSAYKHTFQILKENLIELVIIGGGPEKDQVTQFIEQENLENKIKLIGPIYDQENLKKYFDRSIACISPNQAGLSVLMSFGYGVPFITRVDAITGGEIFNIENGRNGVLYKSQDELEKILIDISRNKGKYLELGLNAYRHYHDNRTLCNMVQPIKAAINFTLKTKK